MSSTGIKNIFIVDDDDMLRMALEDFLKSKTPHQVFPFNTAEECMKNLHLAPDIIILDYYLNSVDKAALNGLDAMQQIKKKFHQVHFIMLSGQERYGIALQSLQKGAEQYVIKDADAFENILGMIESLT
jgi:DNA-binding NarL/FixJ family response regulator